MFEVRKEIVNIKEKIKKKTENKRDLSVLKNRLNTLVEILINHVELLKKI